MKNFCKLPMTLMIITLNIKSIYTQSLGVNCTDSNQEISICLQGVCCGDNYCCSTNSFCNETLGVCQKSIQSKSNDEEFDPIILAIVLGCVIGSLIIIVFIIRNNSTQSKFSQVQTHPEERNEGKNLNDQQANNQLEGTELSGIKRGFSIVDQTQINNNPQDTFIDNKTFNKPTDGENLLINSNNLSQSVRYSSQQQEEDQLASKLQARKLPVLKHIPKSPQTKMIQQQ